MTTGRQYAVRSIVLADGSGTQVYPVITAVCRQLILVYDATRLEKITQSLSQNGYGRYLLQILMDKVF